MKMAEAKLKGRLCLLSNYKACSVGNAWKLEFDDNSYPGMPAYCILEGFRGGDREFKTLENLKKVIAEIDHNFKSFKVVL